MALLPHPLLPAGRLRPSQPDCAPSGLAAFDRLTGGLPRGALTEISGPPSSGRTSLLWAALATVAARRETCALVDAGDAFDPVAAAGAGVPMERLLWVRCGGDPERALKAADHVVHAGGFGLVALDLADIPPRILRRIPLVCWFRLRRAVEGTPVILLVATPQPMTGSSAALVVEMRGARAVWSGAANARLLGGVVFEITPRKPARAGAASFPARAHWAR